MIKPLERCGARERRVARLPGSTMTATAPPLAGLTVLELGQIYNGPYCALLLAHHGAE